MILCGTVSRCIHEILSIDWACISCINGNWDDGFASVIMRKPSYPAARRHEGQPHADIAYLGERRQLRRLLLATMQVRFLLSAPSPKADSVQGLKAGKPLPAGCVQICPVSKAQLWERPFDLPALNRALLKMRGPLSSGRIRKRGTRRCSSGGRAPDFVSRYVVGPSPTVCANETKGGKRYGG